MQKNIIVGTAGHVDHGKTTLIKTLTGTDTDRLKEEKKRGLSIDLGFSCLQPVDDLQLGIVDVPGHEKFIKNMLAGAGGADVGLLVVAADEAVQPQTREHLVILDLLGVNQGVIAVTKTDLVTDEWLELVVEEIKEEVAGTFLSEAPVLPVSAVTKYGLDDLQDKLVAAAKKVPPKNKKENLYLPIDRVFTLSGQGTIVTGTLMQGTITAGEQVEIYPAELTTKIRGLQVHGSDVETAYPGQRVGINLANLAVEDINRGDVLATDNSLLPTDCLDAWLQLLSTAPMILNHGDRIRLHLGAREVIGRVYLLTKKQLLPGEKGLVQFRLEETIAVNFKEKYVLRRYSPLETIGGGEILAVNPEHYSQYTDQNISRLKVKRDGSRKDRIELALKAADNKPLYREELVKQTNLTSEQLQERLSSLEAEGRVVALNVGQQTSWISQTDYSQLTKEIVEIAKVYHQNYHLRRGIDKEELRTKLSINLTTNEYDLLIKDLQQNNQLTVEDAKVSLTDFKIELSEEERIIKQKISDELLKHKFTPPEREELITKIGAKELTLEICSLLMREKKIIKITENLFFHCRAVKKAKQLLKDYLTKHEIIKLNQFRDLLDSSRKYTLPLLEYFDQAGVTKRIGDLRKLRTEE